MISVKGQGYWKVPRLCVAHALHQPSVLGFTQAPTQYLLCVRPTMAEKRMNEIAKVIQLPTSPSGSDRTLVTGARRESKVKGKMAH